MSASTANVIRYPLLCQRSGVQVAQVDFITTAGVVPYMQFWHDHIVYHPVFAMEPAKLLEFARSEWDRAAKLGVDEISEADAEMLRLCFLSLLHSLGSIRQEVPALPALKIVQSHMQHLFRLASWKFWLESKRFVFPTLSLSRLNDNLEFTYIGDYLNICDDARQDYEDGVNDAVEQEKIAQTARAIAALNSSWVTPVSKKLLWGWVRSHLPEKYQPDAIGWLGTLFLGGKQAVLSFEREDIDLGEEIIISSMPAGTGVMGAVRARLEDIRSQWEAHYEAWEIIEDDPAERVLVNGERTLEPDPGPEPVLESFVSRGHWLQAAAKWRLAKARWDKEQQGAQS